MVCISQQGNKHSAGNVIFCAVASADASSGYGSDVSACHGDEGRLQSVEAGVNGACDGWKLCDQQASGISWKIDGA